MVLPSDEPSFRALRSESCAQSDEGNDLRAVRFRGNAFTDVARVSRAVLSRDRRRRGGLGDGGGGVLGSDGRDADVARVWRRAGPGRARAAGFCRLCRHAAAWRAPDLSGRTVPVDAFVLQVESDLDGADVRTAIADGYKAGELLDVSPWPLALVRSGIGPSGSAAVRAFQRAVLTRTIATVKNYSLTNAIAESTLRRDGNGNPAIDKARSAGRIDVLSAAVLAVGEAALCPAPVPMAVYTLSATAASA